MQPTKFKNRFLYIFFLLMLTAKGQEVLPKETTSEEHQLITSFTFKSSQPTAPPDGPVRTAAEWEEVEYLVLTWQPAFENILKQLVEIGLEECGVLIITDNVSDVENYLTANGVPTTNVDFIDTAWDSIWIRDFAGNTIYTDDVGERALVDWIYNRPRPNDNNAAVAHADFLDIPLYRTNSGTNDLVNTGGNYMSDGMGTAFASKLVLEENAAGNPYGVSTKTENEIDAIMENYMGISTYIKMDQVPYDPIDHIDMHMKLLDEQTLLVSKYPDGVADGPYIEANIDYVTSSFETPFDTDYTIEWIDAPPSSSGLYPDDGGYYRTYTNSVFINKTIAVPNYRPDVDAIAMQQYAELLPGYNVVGIDVDNPNENLISLNGAIHCIAHTIGVENPLWIVHQPLEEVSSPTEIPVEAIIKHNSGVQQAKVFWRENGEETFQEIAMSNTVDDVWTGTLNVAESAETIEYYIWAEATSGKTISRPIVAPEGYWTFSISTLSADEWAEQNIHGPYPNPATDQVTFDLHNIAGHITVSIYNVMGQELYQREIHSGNGKLQLDLNPDWQGTLFVRFSGNFGQVHKKVLKR